jgi:hypothetical protein
MKKKLVLWGENADQQKVLLAMELRPENNKVDIFCFDGDLATSELYHALMNDWKEDKDFDFPTEYTRIERELRSAENLLPDNILVKDGELIQRAQTEWHFIVLSEKLYAAYQNELADYKEKVEALSEYDNQLWDTLKAFWDKVQNQLIERNLSRAHTNGLKDEINVLFNKLKEHRAKKDDAFRVISKSVYDRYNALIADVDVRLTDKNINFGRLFDQLKDIQQEFFKERINKEYRDQIAGLIDSAFKRIKEVRFGKKEGAPETAHGANPATAGGSHRERVEGRLSGLVSAIEKMQKSIQADDDDYNFQVKRMGAKDAGQLESQLREAKMKMIQERAASKREKLAEMNKTREDLEKQLEKIIKREKTAAESPTTEVTATDGASETTDVAMAAEVVAVVEATDAVQEDAPLQTDETATTTQEEEV